MQYFSPNSIHSLIRIDHRHNTMWLVMVKDRDGLAVISRQPLDQRGCCVIWPLHQWLPRLIVLHTFRDGIPLSVLLHTFGRCVLDVITPSARFMNPTSANSLLQNLVGYLQLHDLGNARALLGQHIIERLRLDERAGEAVEDESEFAVRLADSIAYDPDDDVVRDEPPGFHHGRRLEPYLSLRADGGPEHVSGGELGDAQQFLDFGPVSSLSGT